MKTKTLNEHGYPKRVIRVARAILSKKVAKVAISKVNKYLGKV
jgi:hypothetical protein